MNRSIRTALSCAFIATATIAAKAPAAAQAPVMQPLADSLKLASDQLFALHSSQFIVADLIWAGYLNFDQHYEIVYDSSSVTVNGRKVGEEIRPLVLRRLSDFTLYEGHADAQLGYGRSSGDGVSRRELLDTASSMYRHARKNYASSLAWPQSVDAQDRLIAEMRRDEILQTDKTFEISYTDAGINVNGAMLTGAQAEKYRMLFRLMLNIDTPKPGNSGWSCKRTTD